MSNDYRTYQDAKDKEYLAACKEAGIEPLLYNDAPSRSGEDDDHDPFATLPAPQADKYFDDPCEVSSDCRQEAAQAVLRVLYALTGSRHPDLRLATDCLLALINRTEEKSQAAIARKYGLTRAAISKRMRDMRKGEFLGGLEIYFFGGREEDSKAARTRATRVHNNHKEQQNLCKAPSLLEQIKARKLQTT